MDDIKFILLELEDKGFKTHFHKNEIRITAPFKIKLNIIKKTLTRIFRYKEYDNLKLYIRTKHRILGCLSRKPGGEAKGFIYDVKVDKDLYDYMCIQKSRYSDIPHYLNKNIEIEDIHLVVYK